MKDFAKAADLLGRAAEIDKAAFGATSTKYAIDINNLGAVYSQWAQATGDADLQNKAREAKEEAARAPACQLFSPTKPKPSVPPGETAVRGASGLCISFA